MIITAAQKQGCKQTDIPKLNTVPPQLKDGKYDINSVNQGLKPEKCWSGTEIKQNTQQKSDHEEKYPKKISQ